MAYGVERKEYGVRRRAYGEWHKAYGVWLLALVFFASAAAGEIKIGGRMLATKNLGGDEFVPLEPVVAAFQGSSVKNDTTKKVTVNIPNHVIVFTPENNVVIVDSVPKHFPLPVRWLDDDLYLPVYFIDAMFPKTVAAKIPTSSSNKIDAFTYSNNGNSFSLAVKVNPAVHYETRTISVKQYQLVIDAVNKTDLSKSFATGIVQKIECRAGKIATITFSLRSEGDIRVTADSTGLSAKIVGRSKRLVRRIVVDPGHGGYDGGAIGPTGLQEKDCNLDIALRLKGKLERELGVEVLMTRDRDVFVSLSDRTDFANRQHAQLFISCHNNAAPSFVQTHGIETYFLSEARTTWERAVEQRENASLRFETPDTNLAHFNQASLILSDMAQNEYLRESSRMAELVEEATAPLVGITMRGINQAGFWVLRKSFMPAILVEGAFITNYREEQLLRNPDFRDRMAEGICQGVKKFVYEYEQNSSSP